MCVCWCVCTCVHLGVCVCTCVSVCTCMCVCMDGPNSMDVELHPTNGFWVLGVISASHPSAVCLTCSVHTQERACLWTSAFLWRRVYFSGPSSLSEPFGTKVCQPAVTHHQGTMPTLALSFAWWFAYPMPCPSPLWRLRTASGFAESAADCVFFLFLFFSREYPVEIVT